MSRKFLIPGIIFLFVAFVLSFLTSISLPTLRALDIVRINTDVGNRIVIAPEDAVKDVRFGIWGICNYDFNDEHHCIRTGHGYEYRLRSFDNSASITIGSSWTRGLAVHPVAAGATFIALCLSFSSYLLAAWIMSFLAAFLTLLAFAIDIALYVHVHSNVGDVSDALKAHVAPGFWLTFVSLLFTLFAGCTIFVGRRKMAGSSPSYPSMSKGSSGVFSRFRK
ncbi:hypothetical protein VKT23_020575 [Stygiomarasmius scandens]|uniref:Pali-domain-containing protein n=1 Tax=Marasmiellus scandens TaxID=2682957 RepID=A0ABR1IIZ4_9AGAR